MPPFLIALIASALTVLPACAVPAVVAPSSTLPTRERAVLALPPDPDTRAIVHTDDTGRRTPLLDPRGLGVYDDLGHGLEPDISVERAGSLGYDLVFTLSNTTDRPAGLGRISVGVITLGDAIEWLNLNRTAAFVPTELRDLRTQLRAYPGQLYSPVAVVRNDRFAVGVSLLYDVLADRHGVSVRLAAPGGRFASGPGGAGVTVGFELGNPGRVGAGDVRWPGSLGPGESRVYRVCVRAVALDRPATALGAQPWLETIEPYRDHFESLYGGVTYERDPRPVRHTNAARSQHLGNDNPMGFVGSHRVDKLGFSPLVSSLLAPRGFERTMLWAPGGMHQNNTDLNFPSRFMSQLETTPLLATAFDRRTGLPRVEAEGHTLGLWWGRATRVAEAWDTPDWRPLDLNDPGSVALALNEMALAHRAGATMIGLDAFTPQDMPPWQMYEWVVKLRRLYPDTTFVLEPLTSDLMHTLGPTFEKAWRGGRDTLRDRDRFSVRHPHYLADYLLPGHEIWGHFRYAHDRFPGNETRLQQDSAYLASIGYVPVMPTTRRLLGPSAAEAEPTWLATVPASLKRPGHTRRAPPVQTIAPEADTNGDTANRAGNTSESGEPPADGVHTRLLTLPTGRVIAIPVPMEP